MQNVVIVEHSLEILRAAFTYVDLSPFLRTKSTFFLINPSPQDVRDFFNQRMTQFTLNGLEIVKHPASWELAPDFYLHTFKTVEECLQGGEILLRTKVQMGGMIQENIYRNLPAVLSNPNASALHSILSGVPAYVVGAGPSLDWNVHQLAGVKDSGVIIAVDTVWKKLREQDIHPHLVVTSDPTYLNARHFEGMEELGETILIFAPSVYHEIPKKLMGTKISLPMPASKFLNALSDVLGDMSYMAVGTNVGQTCFNLARYLGCSPIILVGMDLSFPKDGGTTHAAGTAFRRRIETGQTPGKMTVELISETPEWEEFDPILIPGVLGNEVATNKFWLAYLRSLEVEIQKTESKVINCTEGGARIDGTEIRTLADVVEEYGGKERMVQNTLQMSVGFFFGASMDDGKPLLKEGLDVFAFAAEKSEEGLKRLNALETIAESPSPNPTLLKEQMDEIQKIHEALIQEHKIYGFLDEAADRVLFPFLRLENRPSGKEITDANIKKTITRYRPYFKGMKELCDQFSAIARETLETMKDE